jgi:subtilisin family serine protease
MLSKRVGICIQKWIGMRIWSGSLSCHYILVSKTSNLAEAKHLNDLLYETQRGLKRVRFPEVWGRIASLEFQKTEVAVIDTGMMANHVDLPIPTRFEAFGDMETDLHGHGTWVCGILCAKRNNGLGIAGAVECNLNVYRVFGNNGLNERSYYQALHRLYIDGIKVANLSLGETELDPTEELLLSEAMKRGVILVAAAGNHRRYNNPVMYPAAIPGVIAVGAVDDHDELYLRSSTGNHLFISAPGSAVQTTALRNEYKAVSGTSFAAPFVTAAIATALGVCPALSTDLIRHTLATSADGIGQGWTPEFGHGILNAERFVANLLMQQC